MDKKPLLSVQNNHNREGSGPIPAASSATLNHKKYNSLHEHKLTVSNITKEELKEQSHNGSMLATEPTVEKDWLIAKEIGAF